MSGITDLEHNVKNKEPKVRYTISNVVNGITKLEHNVVQAR